MSVVQLRVDLVAFKLVVYLIVVSELIKSTIKHQSKLLEPSPKNNHSPISSRKRGRQKNYIEKVEEEEEEEDYGLENETCEKPTGKYLKTLLKNYRHVLIKSTDYNSMSSTGTINFESVFYAQRGKYGTKRKQVRLC